MALINGVMGGEVVRHQDNVMITFPTGVPAATVLSAREITPTIEKREDKVIGSLRISFPKEGIVRFYEGDDMFVSLDREELLNLLW